ncbi:HNH endonuclease [Pseudomonas guariconensis]|uniref:HNH endonuclease n=1 Tax=Pseudomonas guariconensis TaxID=1288410 RepID=UPI0036F1BC37
MKELPIAYLEECLSYDSLTGVLTWNVRPDEHFSAAWVTKRFNRLYAGKPAGGRVANGYLMLPFKDENGKRCLFYAHRIAFALHHKRFPEAELDHINGVKTDNRIENLREAVRIQNAANTVFNVQNKRGVRRHPDGKWAAQISHKNKNIYLGLYESEAEAHAAFCGAATVLRSEYAKLTHERD